VTAPVPSAETIHPELPDGVDEVLERALAKDPADRPVSCSELVRDLRDAFRGAARPSSTPAPTLIAPGGAVPAVRRHRVERRPRFRSLVLAAAGLVVAGLLAATMLGAIRDSGGDRDARGSNPTNSNPTTTTETTETTTVEVSGADLNDAGFSLMQTGDYRAARPFLEKAVKALRGSGTIDEAYASYNLAYTRFAGLGICGGVLNLLDRSEAIQGRHPDIDRLREQAYYQCVGGGGGGGDDD
jgi:hypothetical protein